jgi:putative transposase
MRDLAALVLHLLATVARLAGPGGARAVVAESVLVKQQLLILNRSRRRSPNLRLADRVVAGVCTLLMRPSRLVRAAIVLKPSTLLRLHRALTTRKYRRLFSSTMPRKPGPKGPSREVIAAVIDMKQRNPTWGCPRIAQQIVLAFGIPMDKDVVVAFSPLHISRTKTRLGRLRSGSSATRRTVCGASICFDANRRSCAHTGCSW